MKAVSLVDVSLTRSADLLSIGGLEPPAPFSGNVHIHFIFHRETLSRMNLNREPTSVPIDMEVVTGTLSSRQSFEDAESKLAALPYGKIKKVGKRLRDHKDYRTYVIAYEHEGREREFDLPANGPEDVKARLAAMYFGKTAYWK